MFEVFLNLIIIFNIVLGSFHAFTGEHAKAAVDLLFAVFCFLVLIHKEVTGD